MAQSLYMDPLVSLKILAQLLLYVTLFIATIHTVVLGYHWFSYGTSRSMSTIALGILVSGYVLIFAVLAGIIFFLI
jgi:hypothetical protein